MMYQQIFISALLALCLPEVGSAAPYPEVRSESVCTNGIYAELSPALAGYSAALASCSAIYPVECTPDLTEHGAMLAETKIAPQQQEAAWSKLQQQPNSVVSTMCSCIATPKSCSTQEGTTRIVERRAIKTTTSKSPKTTTKTTTKATTTKSTTTIKPTTSDYHQINYNHKYPQIDYYFEYR
ncbi:hypothetical protein PV11_01367 [Exophiala sideris]|uniref:Uncharacterized protein n=1 Tax=Exophiala sideris TaxID=1016849 RepID=A0A0D1XCW1_9EURO|nr:hypothetical protein PV11_01367 [Exophiala sideris]